jgi:hypothetical protein
VKSASGPLDLQHFQLQSLFLNQLRPNTAILHLGPQALGQFCSSMRIVMSIYHLAPDLHQNYNSTQYFYSEPLILSIFTF